VANSKEKVGKMATWFEITYTGEPTEDDYARVAELAAQGFTSGQLLNDPDEGEPTPPGEGVAGYSWLGLAKHEHRYQGQTLRHSHSDGSLPHHYFGHSEDVHPMALEDRQ
jgi:hypothetical protein